MNTGLKDKDAFADLMVRSGVLKFGNFKTKSGRMSPYFINMGCFGSGGQLRQAGRFYADFIMDLQNDGKLPKRSFALFGPAYKGITLAAAASIALAERGSDIPFCFNRKEKKDHGEGGGMIGFELKDGDEVLILDDVITAGTAVRESLRILNEEADVKILGIIVAVDRMERGSGDLSAIDEIKEKFKISVFPMMNIMDIADSLHNREIDGRVFIDDSAKAAIEAHIAEYGAKTHF